MWRPPRKYRHNSTVFIAPYWDAIFDQDAERKQDREDAEATGRVRADTYARFDCQLRELPKVAVKKRVACGEDHQNDKLPLRPTLRSLIRPAPKNSVWVCPDVACGRRGELHRYLQRFPES